VIISEYVQVDTERHGCDQARIFASLSDERKIRWGIREMWRTLGVRGFLFSKRFGRVTFEAGAGGNVVTPRDARAHTFKAARGIKDQAPPQQSVDKLRESVCNRKS